MPMKLADATMQLQLSRVVANMNGGGLPLLCLLQVFSQPDKGALCDEC